MLHLYLGTDREKARAKMHADFAKAKGARVARLTDAHTRDDLAMLLQGGGMFSEKRVIVLENICANAELCEMLLAHIERLVHDEEVFIYEEKPLAELRKKLEKHAEKVEKFDAPKKERDSSIFAIANALKRADKKEVWVSYMREIEKGNAPEAVHGVLFWAAKDMLLKSREGSADHARAALLVAHLAELPHEARRRGEDLEYALERFALSGA